MIDLEPFIGEFKWETINVIGADGSIIDSFIRPDMMCIFRFIILCIIVYYLLRVVFTCISFFK